MLESYITPLFMSYVDKYIKNLKPSDLSLSLWGGDVVLYNLELRLDVLEKELQLPISFRSGKIHKLQIHVPWTKLGSEPVEITINTIECVVQLRDPGYTSDDGSSSVSESSLKVEPSENIPEAMSDSTKMEAPPTGYVQNLLNRVINNVSICVNNVILKYLEDDIVLSLNMKSAQLFSVNSKWEKAFADVTAPDFVLQKVCNISELTICLDKRNANGKIEMYQDPLLYKCALSSRLHIKNDNLLRPVETKLNVYCECLDISLTDQQLPMFVRIVQLCLSLYYGTLDLPGCNYVPHPAGNLIKESASQQDLHLEMPPTDSTQTLQNLSGNAGNTDEDWMGWMWSFVLTEEEAELAARNPTPTNLIMFGLYVSQVTVAIKLTGKVSEGSFFGVQRFEFKPMMSFEISGLAVEVILRGEEFFDAQVGVTAIMGWNVGECVSLHRDGTVTNVNQETETTEDKEEMYLNMRAPQDRPSVSAGFLRGSLFDASDAESSDLELPDMVFDGQEFLKQHDEALALNRYGAMFFDYLYTMEIEPMKNTEEVEEVETEGLEVVGKIRIVKEGSWKRLLVGSVQVQTSPALLHRLELISKLSFEDVLPRKVKSEPFYDEFVEKQLLAGNIPCRQFTISLLSISITLPAADHGRSLANQTDVCQDQVQEQVRSGEEPAQPVIFIQVSRIDLQFTQPMYPTELIKLTLANAEYPAGKMMLQQTYSDIALKIFGVEVNLSRGNNDQVDAAMFNIFPAFSAAVSMRDCILPATWGGSELVKKTVHVEVPVFSVRFTKPQYLLLLSVLNSWSVSLTGSTKISPAPRALINSVFHSKGPYVGAADSILQISMTNTEAQFCQTSSITAVSGSVGTVEASLQSQKDGLVEVTPLVQGPTDMSEVYTGALFTPTHHQDNLLENTEPIMSFTVQLPHVALMSDATLPLQVPGPGEHGLVLFHMKGVAVSLDPVLYMWLSYVPPPVVSASTSPDTNQERVQSARPPSLTRTPSATTPRKKTFARGYGSVASPAKEEKTQKSKLEAPSRQNATSESIDISDGRKAFEAWLNDKLPFLTSTVLQLKVNSITLLLPEKHVKHSPESANIAASYSHQTKAGSLPSTLVICLPTLTLLSAGYQQTSVRRSLPVKLPWKDASQKETLPWTLNAENLAVFSVHGMVPQYHAVRYLVSPVSSTAALASAKTAISPPTSAMPQYSRQSSSGSAARRVSTLGFCVHTDFTPITVSLSRRQIQLLGNLVESVVAACSTRAAHDVTAPVQRSASSLLGQLRKETSSLMSQSMVDPPESEPSISESMSSASFSQIQQTHPHSVRVSLWLQWTMPRFVANLYSHSTDRLCVRVSAELEDLTASIDFQDTMLQMQYKVGALNVNHSRKGNDDSWEPGPKGGILLSCTDIMSYSSPFTGSLRAPPSDTRQSPHGPRGFVTVMYKRSTLHLKRRKSTSEKTGAETLVEDYFKEQHEVKLTVQPFDVVLWTPAITAAIKTFDLNAIGKLSIPVMDDKGETKAEDLMKEGDDLKPDSVAYNIDLLPLITVDMRNLRLFVPILKADERVEEPSELIDQEDVIVLQLSSVQASPHPDNPNSRLVLHRELYEKFRKFGRSSRHALGYDINDVQYQVDMCSFGVWSGRWAKLCGKVSREAEMSEAGAVMDQNPALEWNTQLWRGTGEVRVTPITQGSDFRLVLAPPVSFQKSSTGGGTTVNESAPVCGWSLELNSVSDVDMFLSKAQIQLLQSLTSDNLQMILACVEDDPQNKGERGSCHSITNVESTVTESPLNDLERYDSGIESGRTDATKLTNIASASLSASRQTLPKHNSGASIPWEIIVTGRKITASVYIRRPLEQGGNILKAPKKPIFMGKSKSFQIQPVVQVQTVHPALVMNSQNHGPHILQISCYDVSLSGRDTSTGLVNRLLPEPADFTSKWMTTTAGVPDIHSGILPSLLTVDVTHFLAGPVKLSMDVGRPVHVDINLELLSALTEFSDGLLVPSMPPASPQPSHSSGVTIWLKTVNLVTRELSLLMATAPHPDSPKILTQLSGVKGTASMTVNKQGQLRSLEANVDIDGLGISTCLRERFRPLIHPFSCSTELETIWAAHSMNTNCQGGSGMPQIYLSLDISYLQVNFGQAHVKCLSLLSDLVQPNEGDDKGNRIGTEEFQSVNAAAAVAHSFDDLRAGSFQYVTVAGEVDLHHPDPYQIVFSADSDERPPTMTWAYPEPRALSAVQLVPLPFTLPVLVNTINMGEEYQVPCVLRYWDNAQKCYISYKNFFISENSPTSVDLPNPCTADSAEVIVASEWQVVVDVIGNIDYPDDVSADDDDAESTYTYSPFKSRISAMSLAASVKVNSVICPALIPALSVQVSISLLEFTLSNHFNCAAQGLPEFLDDFQLDPSVRPSDQEFLLFTFEGLSAVTKHVGGPGAFSLAQAEWNCHSEVLDYGDLTYRPLLSPFDMNVTVALHHDAQHATGDQSNKDAEQLTVWLDAEIDISDVLTYVSQTTIHTLSLAAVAWQEGGAEETRALVFNHYVICNDTHEALRFGQVDTDESLLLESRHVHPYSWRVSRSIQALPRLHVCVETEGDWRWSEPFELDAVGSFSRTIRHRLHSATLFIEVKALTGMQKQVIIRGSHIIVSRLSISVDVQILTNPSLGSSQSHTAPYQVLEDVILLADTTLPSYVVSHGGLAGVRIRIPNTTTWSDALPLDCADDEESRGNHVIVQLLGVKDFQTFYFCYSVERLSFSDQLQITLSPLFVIRSHLPEPVLMNVLTTKTNSTTVLPLHGRGEEQQMLGLVPNTWHQLTFQFNPAGQSSSPSLPLNTTLIELANRVEPDSMREKTDLNQLWPYCRQLSRPSQTSNSVESSLVRNITSPVHTTTEADESDVTSQDILKGNPVTIPEVELQCRVVAKWPGLSTLLVDIVPWCLLVNDTSAHVYVKDVGQGVTLQLPPGAVVAPHRFKDKLMLGSSLGGMKPNWSQALSLPENVPEVQPTSSSDANSQAVSLAFVSVSGETRAAQWSVTSAECRAMKIVTVQERFRVLNTTGRCLVIYPVLVPPGRKVPPDIHTRASGARLTADHDPSSSTPILLWDVPFTSAVVLNGEGNATLGETVPAIFLALASKQLEHESQCRTLLSLWSEPVVLTTGLKRQSVAVATANRNSTFPVAITTHVDGGVVHIVLAEDPVPRFVLHNDCPFTLQFGQAIPPHSPTHGRGSQEKLVVMEQVDGLGNIPDVAAHCSVHYELPIMREWFSTSSDVQRLPEFHIQALYNVNLAELSERSEEETATISEVPQGWSKAFDISTTQVTALPLPGRGQVAVSVQKVHLCTQVRVRALDEDGSQVDSCSQQLHHLQPSFNAGVSISQFGITIVDEVSRVNNSSEVLRLTLEGVVLRHSARGRSFGSHRIPEFFLGVDSAQIDSQLEDDLYEFAVILLPTPPAAAPTSTPRKKITRPRTKPLICITGAYGPSSVDSGIFLHSLHAAVRPLTVYLEDKLFYRLATIMESFQPPVFAADEHVHRTDRIDAVLEASHPNIHPLVIGQLKIEPLIFNVTLHASLKLFLAVEDSPLTLGQFELSPVFVQPPALIKKLTFHYVTSALLKSGWVLGSLELLGNPAGLIRNCSQGLADFFFLPYDGLTRGPSAFVRGMSQGTSSLVRHFSTGAIMSITNLASSMARNLDRLGMDAEYSMLQEEQRCRRPRRVFTGLTQGLSGFGLGLLGAVAGIVDQPIQGIRRAGDVREAASGVISGVGKGLIGVVTKPLGGVMDLVSQTGQGILQGVGLTHIPNRLFAVGDTVVHDSKNSHLKYLWKFLGQTGSELLLCMDVTVVTCSGHDYDGAVLLTKDTLYIVNSTVDAIQQTFHVHDLELRHDNEDNRSVVVSSRLPSNRESAHGLAELPDSGSCDRLKKFLRDAQAQAMAQMSPQEGCVGGVSVQKFVLLMDPLLRRYLIGRFEAIKRALPASTTRTDV